ncbi:LOW QUALITY PROTEIN: hypothetical protein ACHAWO_001675 [Cyclotella atomus]|uniref:BTB domain-containing protein n=1 Tax=Cyclotella atomus TaxID=382360 RepID=A0ABD3Q2A4_9STRA
MKRATFIKESSEYLVDGALVIELRMKLSKGQYQSKRYPRPSFRDFMVIRGDEETYDIAINVKGVLVKAHKLIIRAQAGDFYEMCEACSIESPMTIDDVDNVCLEIMINYLYGGDVYPAEWQEHSEAILKAPIWFHQSQRGSRSVFTVENAIDKFLEADGNNFVLVRDAARKFMIEHAAEIVETEAFERLHVSLPLMKEVFVAAIQNSKKRKRDNE